jgi:hypothetical protein
VYVVDIRQPEFGDLCHPGGDSQENSSPITLPDKTSPILCCDILEIAILNLQPAPLEGTILTDDLAPVEWITNAMIFDLLFSENVEALH